jgi:DHA2 family multidrug resistance protein
MQTGELLIPGAIASGITMIIAGKLVGRFDPRMMVAAGAIITSGVMLALSTINPDTGANNLFWPLMWRGFGSVLMFLPLSIATLGSLPRAAVPAASGFYNLTRQLGGSLGVAILTTMLDRREAVHRAVLVENVSLYRNVAVERFQQLVAFFQARGSDVVAAHNKALAAIDGVVMSQVAVRAFSDLFLYVAVAFIVTLPLLLLLGRGGHKAAAEAAH